MTAAAALRRLQSLADPERARTNRSFFKTAPGEYGENDQFIGLRVPQLRVIAREFRSLPLTELEKLLRSKWHEGRLLAVVILVEQFERGDETSRATIYRAYLANTAHINNWDLVDASAPTIVGGHLLTRSRAPLIKLAKSKSLWERRIAIIATQHFIRLGDFDTTWKIAKILLHDSHDLIHKATGWMLREAGNRDRAAEEKFLDEHAAEMPRTMLRYAIEKFPPALRRRYLALS